MDRITRSYVIYFGLLIFCFVVAGIAEKRNNKKLIFLIALALSVIGGLRHLTVGIDTNTYYWAFEINNSFKKSLNYNDPMFYVLGYLLKRIYNDPYFPIFVISSISYTLVTYRLWDFNHISSYKYSILRFIGLFFFYSFNCMRQFFSMAIVFYGTKYIEQKKYNKFLLFVGIASLFHVAALTSVAYLLFEKIRWKELNRKQKNLVNISFLLSPIIITVILNMSYDRFERYFLRASGNELYYSFILKIILFALYYLIVRKSHKNDICINNNISVFGFDSICLYYFVGMMITGLGYIWYFVERIGYYYYLFSMPYIGMIAKEKKYRILFRIIILIILIRSFYNNIYQNSTGQLPYMFNWE